MLSSTTIISAWEKVEAAVSHQLGRLPWESQQFQAPGCFHHNRAAQQSIGNSHAVAGHVTSPWEVFCTP